jgi:hypothetical protein
LGQRVKKERITTRRVEKNGLKATKYLQVIKLPSIQ